jgi:hypothetical protein
MTALDISELVKKNTVIPCTRLPLEGELLLLELSGWSGEDDVMKSKTKLWVT